MNLIQELEKEQFEKLSAARAIPDFAPGDTLIVNVKVVEGDRSRVQAYEGVCIGRTGGGLNESFTVRKISYGEGVERVFPVMSPMIDLIKVVRRARCVAPSCITCATCAASRPASSRRRNTPRPPSASNRASRLLHWYLERPGSRRAVLFADTPKDRPRAVTVAINAYRA